MCRLYCACHATCIFPDRLQMSHACHRVETATATKPSRLAHFSQGTQSPAPARQNDIWTFKSAPYPSVFGTFGLQRRALFRHVNFQKSSKAEVFVHIDLEMCFVPQRREHFPHVNDQKWSGHGVLCTFWLRNVRRTTRACNFSSLIWPDGSAPAALASLLSDPPEPQIIGKNGVNIGFSTFSRACIFFLLTPSLLWSSLLVSSLTLPTSAFHLSILSEVDF